MNFEPTRIGAYQGWSHPGDVEANVELICRILSDASDQSIELLVFPEMFLTGYMIWEALPDAALDIDDEPLETIRSAARRNSIVTVLGFPEVVASGKCSNAVIIIDRDGRVAGIHRKLHLFRDEDSVFIPGSEINVFPTAIGNIGVAICYDIEFPEMARELTLAGADIIAVSTANMVPYQQMQGFTIQSRAWENGIPIVLANYFGSDAHHEYFGDSCIVDSCGRVIQRADSPNSLIVADLNLGETPPHQFSYLSRRRPDAYQRQLEI